MFCKKCGKELPDDAIFCAKCGTETIKKPTNTPLTDHVYKDETARKNARDFLVREIEKEKSSKTTRLAVIGILAFIAFIIAMCAFSSISSGKKLTQGALLTLFFSGSAALGLIAGMIKVNIQCNKIINEKQARLDQYDRDAEMK